MFLVALVLLLCFGKESMVSLAKSAADYNVEVSTNRKAGTCSYTVSGLDIKETNQMAMEVFYIDGQGEKKIALTQSIALDDNNCKDGKYAGQFAMADMKTAEYKQYTVSVSIGDVTVTAEKKCDFSIHTDKCKVIVDTNKDAKKRKVTLQSSEATGEVIIPGSNTEAKVFIWKSDSKETDAAQLTETKNITNTTQAWNVDITKICKTYGTYYAKVALDKGANSLGKVKFSVGADATSIGIEKSKALEGKKKFAVSMKGFSSPISAKKIEFELYNSKNKKVYTKTATAKKDGTYYAEIALSALDYKLDTYKIKAFATDGSKNRVALSKTGTAKILATAKSLTITKRKSDRTSTFTLKKAYIPGNIKQVQFYVYYVSNGKETLQQKVKGTYTASKDTYKATIKNKKAGNYTIYAYGYTKWDKKVLLKQAKVKVSKSEAARNGWYYEKYNGKTYKFYYKDDQKQTDLTKILKIKKGTKLYIEVNRAACAVTVYAYDAKKKKYIIPVKTFTVSVGRDVSTVAGAGSLNIHSSFTPIGDFSICSNGSAVKYSLKPMHEPDGSTVYARWTSHIVGNVYFHSIAVGSQSHYALNPYTYNRLGSPASAGCIRMTVADSKWLYDYAATGSKVKIVVGNRSKPGPLGKAKTIKVTSSIHYDPTDPAVPDSRKKADYKAGRISGYMTKKGKKVGY